jgi:DNA-binding CsgD family transcriptional regulator
MPDLMLSEREQRLVRSLLALDPVPGDPVVAAPVLELVSKLVPSDEVGVGLADSTGRVVSWTSLPQQSLGSFDPQVCDGPLPLGLVHQSRDPDHQELLAQHGIADGVVIGYRNGPHHVVQISLVRRHRMFAERDLALLAMIAPALQRLLRIDPTPRLPPTLTVTERRVLQLLALGMSNADIAADLYVAPSTVRKHLEHAFPKLGVTNRLAAARAFESGLASPQEAPMFAR